MASEEAHWLLRPPGNDSPAGRWVSQSLIGDSNGTRDRVHRVHVEVMLGLTVAAQLHRATIEALVLLAPARRVHRVHVEALLLTSTFAGGVSGAHTSGGTAVGAVQVATGASASHTSDGTAAGVVGESTGSSGAATSGATATGATGVSSGASAATTSGGTAAGVVGESTGGSGAATSGGTAAGSTGVSTGASAAHTSGGTATGSLGVNSGATAVHTSGGTADGVTAAGLTGDSSAATTSGGTAAGVVGLSTGATGAHTDGGTATGSTGLSGGASAAETSGGTATGAAGVFSGASAAHTSGATAAGLSGVQSGGTAAHTTGGTAAGVVGTSSDAAGAATAGATASGSTGTSGGATTGSHTSGGTAAGSVDVRRGASTAVHTSGATADGSVSAEPAAGATALHVAGAHAYGIVEGTPSTIKDWTGGRYRSGSGVATWTPPVVPPPVGGPGGSVGYVLDQMTARVIDSVTVDPATGDVTVTERVKVKARHMHRILVNNHDVTFFRGVETPPVEYGLSEPLLYGSGHLRLPQINALWDHPGGPGLRWLVKYAEVLQQRVDPVTGAVVATDYIGFISDFDHDGGDFTCTLGGQAMGRLEMAIRPPSIFPDIKDIGGLIHNTIKTRAHLSTVSPPVTGVLASEEGGGSSELDYLLGLTSKSTMRNGTVWTVMPNASGSYKVLPKDGTTIDFTVYLDDELAVPSLRRDFTAEPDVVWANAVAPDGRRIQFSVYPGLDLGPRPSFPGNLSPGDSGAGVETMIWRLWEANRLPGQLTKPDLVWTTSDDDPITQALTDLQQDAGLHETGHLDAATWRALWDVAVNVYSMRGTRILPAAYRNWVKPWLLNASGQRVGRNPLYDGQRPRAHASYDMGNSGNNEHQVRKWARHEIPNENAENYLGTITINGRAVIHGEHNPGDPFDASMLRDVRQLRPGMNAWLPTFRGGIKVHVTGIDFDDTGTPRLTVDTLMRDNMKVWEVIARNRESRHDPRRAYIISHRTSTTVHDSGGLWDRAGGRIMPVDVPAHVWTPFAVPAGREGSARELHMSTRGDRAEFVVCFFGHAVTPQAMDHMIGNPFTDDGRRAWRKHYHRLREQYWLNYSAGTGDNPCGYSPSTKADIGTDQPDSGGVGVGGGGDSGGGTTFIVGPTGDWIDDMSWPYFCVGEPILKGYIYADRDTQLQGGRIMTLLLDDQT